MGNSTNLTESNFSITATPVEGKNYVHLEWTNLGTGYTYMVYSKSQDEAVYQSIPSKTNIKVLNVYPNAGNNLKTWMETDGYGKGLIAVDSINLISFNTNPDAYLKEDNGDWKYDVVYFGAWNSNNGLDLSSLAATATQKYIETGRGVLFGHDTMCSGYTNFWSLRNYLNMTYSPQFSGVWKEQIGEVTKVKINKKGLLVNYPYVLDEVLTIPLSHSNNHQTNGDIWIKFLEATNRENPCKYEDPANFYLMSYNNCAMIQTGNNSGQATEDEQKILANTLFYLAQLTSNTVCDDHKGQDFAKPDNVSITSVSNDNKNLNINYSKVNDNGTKYEYYVKASDGNTANDITSNTISAINTSGLAGYSYVIDNIENTEPGNKIDTKDISISAPLSGLDLSKPIYIHVKAIDNAGNFSETTHYKYKYRDKEVILNIEPQRKKIHLNENVLANLTIDNIKEIAAEDAKIKYDSTKLKFLGMNEVKGIKLVLSEKNDDELRLITASEGLGSIVNDKKILLKLYFKGIAQGEALVDVTKGKVSDGIEMEKDLMDDECGQATIIIDDISLDDVNRSGEFTLLDLAIDARHLGEDPTKLPQYNTDQVINGAIDNDDLLQIGDDMLANPNYKFN